MTTELEDAQRTVARVLGDEVKIPTSQVSTSEQLKIKMKIKELCDMSPLYAMCSIQYIIDQKWSPENILLYFPIDGIRHWHSMAAYKLIQMSPMLAESVLLSLCQCSLKPEHFHILKDKLRELPTDQKDIVYQHMLRTLVVLRKFDIIHDFMSQYYKEHPKRLELVMPMILVDLHLTETVNNRPVKSKIPPLVRNAALTCLAKLVISLGAKIPSGALHEEDIGRLIVAGVPRKDLAFEVYNDKGTLIKVIEAELEVAAKATPEGEPAGDEEELYNAEDIMKLLSSLKSNAKGKKKGTGKEGGK